MGLKWKQRAMKKKEAHDHTRDAAIEEMVTLEMDKSKQKHNARKDESFKELNESYRHSGNLELYTDENLFKREHLFDHPHVQHTLLLWWVVILNKYGETNEVKLVRFHKHYHNQRG